MGGTQRGQDEARGLGKVPARVGDPQVVSVCQVSSLHWFSLWLTSLEASLICFGVFLSFKFSFSAGLEIIVCLL